MPERSLVIAFDGPAVRDGSMDVRELAPALLAFGHLLDRANLLLNGERAQVSVRVRSVHPGSFEVNLELWQTVVEHLRNLLTAENLTAVDGIIDNIFTKAAGAVGVFELIKLLKGRKAKRRRVLKDGNVEIELPDGTTVTAKPKAVTLYDDHKIREDAAASVRPVKQEGIDKVEVRRDTNVLETITKADTPSFEAAAEKIDYRTSEPLLSSTAPRLVEIVKPSFADDLVWTLSGGEGERFTARMGDEDFQARVDRGEVFFKKGDLAIVDVASKSWIVDGKPRTEHEIVRVRSLEHKPGGQMALPTAPGERSGELREQERGPQEGADFKGPGVRSTLAILPEPPDEDRGTGAAPAGAGPEKPKQTP